METKFWTQSGQFMPYSILSFLRPIAFNSQEIVRDQSNIAKKVPPKSAMKVPPQKTVPKTVESKKVDLNCKYCNTYFT